MPSSVMMADVSDGTRNSSAANLRTAVNGVVSGTLSLCDVGEGRIINKNILVTIASELQFSGRSNLHFEGELRIRSKRNFECYFRAGKKVKVNPE